MLENIKEGIRATIEQMFLDDKYDASYTIPAKWQYNKDLEESLSHIGNDVFWYYVEEGDARAIGFSRAF